MKISNKTLLDDHLTEDAASKVYAKPWLLVVFVATFGLGILSAYCRPYFNIDGIHWEAIVSMVVLVTLNVVCLMLISTDKRKGYGWFYSILTLLLWTGYVLGWSFVNGDFMEDLIGVGTMTAIVAILIGMVVFYYQNRSKKSF
jgi:hypothetical protein